MTSISTKLLRGLVAGAAINLIGAAQADAQKQAPPAPGAPRNFTLPKTADFSLPNGLDVTLVPYGSVPKAWMQLVVRTGNANEKADEVWLSDIVGDMMEEGTTTRTAQEVAGQAAGMGGSVNIGNSLDETTISASALSEFIPRMVELVADVARNPRFPESELQRLRNDRIRALAQAKAQPSTLALERFRGVMYGDHPYGRVLSTEAMINSFDAADVRNFYTANFGADRAHLYIAGKFDRAATEAAIRSAFSGWARGPAATAIPAKPVSARSIALVDRPGAVQSTVILGLPVLNPSHPDYPALAVTNALLGGSFGSRITRNIRENKGYTYSPFSSVSSRYRDAYWAQQADVTTDVTGASLKEIFLEIDRLRAEPPPVDELRGIQNYLGGIFVLQNSSATGIIGQLRFLNLHGLGRDYLENFVKRVHAVTPADVTRMARTHIRPDQMTIVVVGDKSKVASQLAPYGLQM
ncbi:MAG TPA: pitrilysin family protein [Gemmatimonadaceae bacterium]|nr:pitrilysin family protein [Gemmatimonadaceae bacterium]